MTWHGRLYSKPEAPDAPQDTPKTKMNQYGALRKSIAFRNTHLDSRLATPEHSGTFTMVGFSMMEIHQHSQNGLDLQTTRQASDQLSLGTQNGPEWYIS